LEGGTDHFSGDGIHALDRGPPPTQRRGGRAVAQGTVDDIDVDVPHDTAALERELAKLNATVDAKTVEKKKKLDVGTHTSSYTLLGDGDCRCTGDGGVDRYVSSAWSDLGYDVADCQDVCSSYSWCQALQFGHGIGGCYIYAAPNTASIRPASITNFQSGQAFRDLDCEVTEVNHIQGQCYLKVAASEYMEQFSEADLCHQEIEELEIDEGRSIYIWRFDEVYPKKFEPMDPTSWKAKRLMEEFEVDRWEEFEGEFDDDEDRPLRQIVGVYIDDQKLVTAVSEHRSHEDSMRLIRDGSASGDRGNTFFENPGEVACWRLSLERGGGPGVDTCRYECCWRVQPFRGALRTFAMSSCFLVMTGDQSDYVSVLVWTALPDPEGRLGVGVKGAPRADVDRQGRDDGADQERLQYGPASDASDTGDSSDDEG